MYVLLYTNQDNQPSYIQGSIDEINAQLRTLWVSGDVNRDDWEFCSPWQLLGIEDGALTPMGNVECSHTPYFELY